MRSAIIERMALTPRTVAAPSEPERVARAAELSPVKLKSKAPFQLTDCIDVLFLFMFEKRNPAHGWITESYSNILNSFCQ